MATCGYLCPKCEGKGFLDDGTICDWCEVKQVPEKEKPKVSEQDLKDWIETVHEGPCCSDQ